MQLNFEGVLVPFGDLEPVRTGFELELELSLWSFFMVLLFNYDVPELSKL